MKIELYKNRESDLKDNQFCGTQFEQNAYKLMFDFDNLVELLKDKVNVIKTIHFFHDDFVKENFIGDGIIENNEFYLTQAITKYQIIYFFVQINAKDFRWTSKAFKISLFDSLNVDGTLPEDKKGILQTFIEELAEIKNDVLNGKYNGITPAIGENGNWFLGDTDTGKPSRGEQGIQGIQGVQGIQGIQGVQGIQGDSGVYCGSEEPDENKNVWINPESNADKFDYENDIENRPKINNVELIGNKSSKELDLISSNDLKNYYSKEESDVTHKKLNERLDDIKEDLNSVKNNVLSTGSASGSFINIQDSAESKIKELSIEGILKQDTTTGKNLLPTTDTIDKKGVTFNGVTFKLNDDGSITATGTATSSMNIYLNKDFISMDPGTYTLSDSVATGESSTTYFLYADIKHLDGTNWAEKNLATYAVNTSTIDEQFLYKSRIVIRNGIRLNNVTFYPQLEIGSSATSYEPYTGCQPSPSPEFPQEIRTITGNLKLTSCNKNLINKNLIDRYYSYTYGSVGMIPAKQQKNNNRGTLSPENAIIICANTNYTLTVPSGIKFAIAQMKSDFVSLGDTNWLMSTKSPYTIKTSPNAKYIAFNFSKDDNSNFSDDEWNDFINGNLQLEQNSTATSFEEHLESIVNINLPSDEFIGKINDTYKDELVAVYNQEDCKYHLILNKMIGKINLNGSEEWGYASDYKYFRVTKYTFEKIPLTMTTNNKSQYSQISNYFKLNKNWSGTNSFRDGIETHGEFYPIQDTGYKLAFRNLDFDDLSSWIDWLEKNNTDVYYPLANVYQVDLGPIDMLKTYEGVTNIFTDSDLLPNIQAKYYQNFETTIKNLKVNEQSLKQELSDIKSRLAVLESREV